MLKLCFVLLAVFVAACGTSSPATPEWSPPELPPTIDPADVVMARAQQNYDIYCAHCHGYSGQGQSAASVERTLSLGYRVVPRHDSQGDTWRYPDQLLFEVIKYGTDNPLNFFIMTGYEFVLNDDDILEIIDYMRRFWTDEQRQHQAQLTELFAETHPDWAEQHLTNTQDESP